MFPAPLVVLSAVLAYTARFVRTAAVYASNGLASLSEAGFSCPLSGGIRAWSQCASRWQAYGWAAEGA